MPSLGLFTGDEMLAGDHQGVMATHDGRLRNASDNRAPNPDLRDFDARGRVLEWILKVPQRWDGWNIGGQRLTRIKVDGTHELLRQTNLLKQNLAKLTFNRNFYDLRDPLRNGGPMRLTNAESDVPRPVEVPRVVVRERLGSPGMMEATWPVVVFYVVDDDVANSRRLTSPSPPAFVTTGLGQRIEVFRPDLAEGVSGFGIGIGLPDASGPPYFVARLIDLRRDNQPSYTVGGPLDRDRRVPLVNETYVGSYNAFPPPRHEWVPSDADLFPMETYVSATFRTDAGVTASQQISNRIIVPGVPRTLREFKRIRVEVRAPGANKGATRVPVRRLEYDLRGGTRLEFPNQTVVMTEDKERGDEVLATKPLAEDLETGRAASDDNGILYVDVVEPHKGQALEFLPRRVPVGARQWRLDFIAEDGAWYALTGGADADGFRSLDRPARMHSNNPEGMGRLVRPIGVERTEVDESGLPAPEAAPETPVPVGDTDMPPGRYRVRLSGEGRGEESAASPAASFTLRDAGLAAGGAASFVSDQFARVYRPQVQWLRNERFTIKNAEEKDVDWEEPEIGGVNITNPQDGVLRVADTTALDNAAASTITQDVKRSVFHDMPGDDEFVLRGKVEMPRRNGGKMALVVRYFTAAGAQVGADDRLITVDSVTTQDEELDLTFGPVGTNCEVERPAAATQMRFVVLNIGTAASPRDLTYVIKDLGLWTGHASNRKRYPVDFGLSADEDDSHRSPAAEAPENPYPEGGWARVVENPNDGPRRPRANVLRRVYFENNVIPADLTQTETGDGEVAAAAVAALTGDYGIRAIKENGSAVASTAGVSLEVAGARRSISAMIRPRRIITSGGIALLSSLTAAASGYIAEVRQTADADLLLWYKSAGVESSLLIRREWLKGAMRVELQTTGIGSLSGAATVHVERRGRPPLEFRVAGLDWTAYSATSGWVFAGVRNAAAGANYTYHLDRLVVSEDGEFDLDPLPGNYIEGWLPKGTAYSDDNLATGYKVPARQNQKRVISCYAGSMRSGNPGSLGKLVAKNERGVTIREIPGWLAEKVRNGGQWDRYHLAYTTPPATAWVEWERNRVADGYFRMGYFKDELDPGDGKPTPYNNDNSADGYFEGSFRTSVPGRGPMEGADMTLDWLRIVAMATHEYDGAGNPLTFVSTRIKAADTQEALDAAVYYDSVGDLIRAEGMREWARVRTRVWNTDTTRSATVRGVRLDVQRAVRTLLKPDGTEFHMGSIIFNWKGLSAPRNVKFWKFLASGGVDWRDLTLVEPPRWAKGWGVELFSQEAREELVALQGKSREPFIAEVDGKRYGLFFFGVDPAGGEESMGEFWDYKATEIEALCVSVEDM